MFKQPFEMFAHRWERLLKYGSRFVPATVDTSQALEEFGDISAIPSSFNAWEALVKTMQPIVQPCLDAVKRIKDTGLVTWDNLSLILPPGEMFLLTD